MPDAFVAKLGIPCTGTSCTTTNVPLNYFTYVGGSGTDVGLGIAVDVVDAPVQPDVGAQLIAGLGHAADLPADVLPGPALVALDVEKFLRQVSALHFGPPTW